MSPTSRWCVVTLALLVLACGGGEGDPTPDAASSCDPTECDDGAFCNGEERCDERGCAAGAPPCLEGQSCDEVADRCVTLCDVEPDADGDGHASVDCGGDDCNDADERVNPSATEVCDVAGLDEDCDPTTFGDRDADGDGAVDALCCNGARCGTDCDDARPGVSPTAPEVCNERDDDCDGSIDEEVLVTYYRDADGDGDGTPDVVMRACAPGAGWSTTATDCDDAYAARNPGAPEVCDGLDNDCDELVDETPSAVWYRDSDGDGFGLDSDRRSACSRPEGYAAQSGDCDDTTRARNPSAPEICDGLDNDCDGTVDESATASRWYLDADGDGAGRDDSVVISCSAPPGHVAQGGDCDDENVERHPWRTETCNAIDDDCDGATDERLQRTFYRDGDGDGFGTETETTTACSRPVGYADVPGDCDDTNRRRSPALPEVCDGLDNDCNGSIDDGASSTTWYRDSDGDGFGVTADFVRSCSPPAGYALSPGDCDDANASRNPAAPEVCDGVDNDCDGLVDDGVLVTYFRDADGDGYGLATASVEACRRPDGYASLAGDCDDGTSARSPALPELCDGVDNDCNGAIDDGIELPRWYRDADGDGFGNVADVRTSCGRPVGYVGTPGDCDDTRSARNPAAPEVCDGLDNDCDGLVDDGVTLTFFRDADGDGFGTVGSTTQACSVPAGYSTNALDCDDTTSARNPAATEVCDGIDNDCNGRLDAPGEDPDGDGYTSPACGGADCDNGRSDVFPGAPELCDGRDNDCDGLLDGPGEDADRDGYASLACGGNDCDDVRASVNPGARELCNGRDDDCNGLLDAPGEDDDRDGYASIACGGGDCNDTRADTYPGAPERCDGRDTDCDGLLDAPGEDDDRDGHADPIACGATCTGVCDDCDDTRADVFGRTPGMPPPPTPADCDGIDNDCDGVVDDLDAQWSVLYDAQLSYRVTDSVVVGDELVTIGEDSSRGSTDLVLVRARLDDGAIVQPRTFVAGTFDEEASPSIAWTGSDLVVVYTNDSSSVRNLHYLRLGLDGVVRAGPTRLVSSATTAQRPIVSLDSTRTRLMLSWIEGATVRRAIFRVSDGAMLFAPTAFTGIEIDPAYVTHRQACDAVARTCVVTLNVRGPERMVAMTYDETGAQIRGPVSTSTLWSQSQDVVALGNRYVAVVWSGATVNDLRLRELGGTGATVGDEIRVSVSRGDPRHYLRLVATPQHVYVLWFDGAQLRRRSDLSQRTGTYRIQLGFGAGNGVSGGGVVGTSTTDNGSLVSFARVSCF